MINLLTSESALLIHSLGWSLLHSLWQGALVSLCLWVVLKVLQHHGDARLRYRLLFSAQVLLGGWFIMTWIQEWQRLRSLTVIVTETATQAGLGKTYTVESVPQTSAISQLLFQWLPDTGQVMPWLVGGYILGLGLMLLRFGAGLTSLFRLHRKGITQPDPAVSDLFRRLKDRMYITLPVQLVYSARITMPMMLGALKPVILLPMATVVQLSMAELEAIILHELAHIKRQDYLMNMVQIFIETALFFNPFIWWLSAGIRREREHCCDDLVIAQTQQPLPYAKALAALEAQRYASTPFALAAAGQKQHLFNRIKRIIEMKKTPLSYGRLAAALITAGALIFSVAWFTPAFAQKKKEEKPAPKVTTVQRIVIVDDQGERREYDMANLPAAEKERLQSALESVDATTGNKTSKVISQTRHTVVKKSGNADEHDETAMEDHDFPPMPPMPPMPAMPSMPPVAPMAAMPPMPPMPPMDDMDDAVNSAVTSAMNAVDWAAIRKETRAALNEARKETREALNIARKEARAAMKDIDWDEINKQMRDASREAQRAMKASRDQMNEDRQAARKSMAIAHTQRLAANSRTQEERGENNLVAQGLKKLEKDGLIDPDQGYNVEKKNDRLYINGKKQDEAVTEKYRKYFNNKRVIASGTRNSQSITTED